MRWRNALPSPMFINVLLPHLALIRRLCAPAGGFRAIALGLIRTIGFPVNERSRPPPPPIAKKSQSPALFRRFPLSSLLRIPFSTVNFGALQFNRFTALPINQCAGLPPDVPRFQSGNLAHRALPIYQTNCRVNNERRTPLGRRRRSVVAAYSPANRPVD